MGLRERLQFNPSDYDQELLRLFASVKQNPKAIDQEARWEEGLSRTNPNLIGRTVLLRRNPALYPSGRAGSSIATGRGKWAEEAMSRVGGINFDESLAAISVIGDIGENYLEFGYDREVATAREVNSATGILAKLAFSSRQVLGLVIHPDNGIRWGNNNDYSVALVLGYELGSGVSTHTSIREL